MFTICFLLFVTQGKVIVSTFEAVVVYLVVINIVDIHNSNFI